MNTLEQKYYHKTVMRRRIILIVFLSFIYKISGYAITFVPNPILNNLPIAFTMALIVCIGIIFGKYTGACVGALGSILGIFFAILLGRSPLFAIANIIPHAIMGFSAGFIAKKYNVFFSSLMIVIGHILNILAFYAMQYAFSPSFPVPEINAIFFTYITYEVLIDIVAINILCTLFYISYPFIREKW